MVSGTYVLTDSIDKAFDTIFTEVAAGLDAVDHRQVGVRPLRRQRRDRAGVRRERARRRCAASTASRRPRAASTAIDDADRPRRQGDRLRRRAEPRLRDRARRVAASTRSPSSRATGRAERGRDRQRHGRQGGLRRSATTSASRPRGLSRGCKRLGHRQVRLVDRRSAARRSPASTCRPRSGSSSKVGKLDEIARRRGARVTSDAQLIENTRARAAARHAGAQRPGAGRGGRGRHERVHHLPAGLPARLRRHRALRRQLRDRELALDHDRAAHARVRDAAHARRLAPAGARTRSSSRRSWSARLASVIGLFLGLGLAKLLFWLFDAVGLHAAEQRPALRDAHDRRLAAGRHHRDAAREPASGDPRDARAADRGRARGRDAAASRASPASARPARSC